MSKLLSNAKVRLAGRAILAGVLAAVVQINTAPDGTLSWRSAVVAGGLAFCEIFTPLNSLVGFFKQEVTKVAP